MDATKIPNALQVMMDQLFMNNSLKSWGVFPNKYGQLCLNIRFDICELDQSSKPVTACAVRRISDKQLARNASRNINNNKRRKLNPSISTEDKTTSQTYQFSKPVYPSPELARSSSVSVTPDAGYIDSQDSPILPVEEDSPTNSVKEGMKMNMECDSIFKYYSPAISTPLNSNLERNLNSLSNISNINPILHPILKQDAASQVDYVTSSNSTQTDYIQKHQIIQCSAKIKSKSTQSGLVKVSEQSIQVDPAPIVQINSSIQHQPITADKSVQMGSDIIEQIPVDESIISCPCCYEDMSATHECAIAKSRDDSTDSLVYTPNDNEICTSIPDQTIPLSTSPPHSANHPNPEPPDGSTPTLNVDNIIWGLSALWDSKIK